MPTRLTKEEREAIEWTRRHRKGIKLRNKVVIGIAMFAWTIFIAGYVNYYMLLGIPTAYLAQFFGEIGLIAPLILGNSYIIIRLGGEKVNVAAVGDARSVTVAVALVAVVFSLALAGITAAVAVVLVMCTSMVVAEILYNKK